ncbi:hypothetical protein ACTFIR_001518 [Dictyostelium discoideum]
MDNQNNNNALANGDSQFTMPKVIDYLQNEWLKFEVDRAHWISEKAELTNRILKLESERKLFESHKFDLCRRVKMLEYALQQERLKNNSLLQQQQKVIEKVEEEDEEDDKIPKNREPPKKSKDNTTRLIIRKYLREMGYNDLIISKSLQTEFENDSQNIDNDTTNTIDDSNDTTVKTILNLKDINNNNNNNNNNSNNKNQTTTTTTTTTTSPPPSTPTSTSSNKTDNTTTTTTTSTNGNGYNSNTIISPPSSSSSSSQSQSQSQPQPQLQSSLSELINNTTDLSQSLDSLSSASSGYEYDSLLDNLKQLDNSSVSSNSGNNSINSSSDSLDTSKQSQEDPNNVTISKQQQQEQQQESDEQSFNSFNEDIFNKLTANSKGRMKIKGLGNFKNYKKEHMGEEGNLSLPDQNTEEKSTSTTTSSSSSSTGSTRKKKSSSSSSSSGSSSSNSNTMNSELMGLGASDLNDITLDDGSKGGNDSAAPRVWKFKHSLKSHFDGVRSIQFHPNEPIMISASEDNSIKVWNLNHLVPTKKSPSPEIEPLYTIRGHTGPVFTSEWNQINGEYSNYQSFFSAGYDMIIRQWSLPSPDIDSYLQHGKILPYLEKEFIGGHQDGIWDLLSIPNTPNLLSSSADGTVSLWNTTTSEQLYTLQHCNGLSYIPTSIALPATENNRKLLTSYNDGSILLFDLETQQIISQIKQGSSNNNSNNNNNSQINKIVSHPFMPLAMTGSEDHKIEFFDLNSNTVVHSMIAHSNSISSLTIDPSGLYIASCAHDSSIRFWDISSKTCIQDLNSHRPKYDESIHCIKYHPNKGYFASGGADSVIRILN